MKGWTAAAAVLLGSLIAADAALSQTPRTESAPEVRGVVVDSNGKGIPFAYVFLGGTGSKTVASAEGVFNIVGPAGDAIRSISVRRIGFRPALVSVDSSQRGPLRIVLDRLPQYLDAVVVEADESGYDEYLDRNGYYRRLRMALGSTFVSEAEIERRNAFNLTQMLRDVAGVRIVSSSGKAGKGNYAIGRGGLCALGLVVDGQRIEIEAPSNEQLQPRIQGIMGGRGVSVTQATSVVSGSLDEIVPPSMVAGMEVYPSASAVPNELQQHVRGCGLIVVWTRFH